MIRRIISLILCIILLSTLIVFAAEEGDDRSMEYLGLPAFSGGDVTKNIYSDDISFKDSFTYFDVDDRVLEYKIETLRALGFVKEVKPDYFEPQSIFTRAEFVDSVVKVLNIQNIASGENTYYTDVSNDNKYLKSINAATANGLISGIGESEFAPDEPIGFTDAVSVLVKAVGCGFFAEQKGGYPSGYMMQAKSCGLLSGLSDVKTEKVTRKIAVELIYNLIQTEKLVFGGITGSQIEYKSGNTVLNECHDIYCDEGILDGTFVSSLYDDTVKDVEQISINGVLYNSSNQKFIEYLGYPVTVYYTVTDGQKNVVHILKSIDFDETVISAESITDFSNLKYTYYDGKKDRNVSIPSNHSLIVNGVCQQYFTEDEYIPKNGEVKIIKADENYTAVIIDTFSPFLLNEYSSNDEGIVFESYYDVPSFKIDIEEEEQYVAIYIDGKLIDLYNERKDIYNADGFPYVQYQLPHIPQNAVMNIFADKYDTVFGYELPSADAKFIKIVITTKTIEGKIDSISENTVYIADEECEIAPVNLLDKYDAHYEVGAVGTLFFDYDNNVFAFSQDNKSNEIKYGYLINAAVKNESFADKAMFKILDTDGSINVYSSSKKIKINDGQSTNDFVDVINKLKESAKLSDVNFTISQLIKYSTNDSGELNRIYTLTESLSRVDSELELMRSSEKTKMTTRNENGWHLYPNTGDLQYLSLFKYNPKVKFSVPSTETFRDEDYGLFYDWITLTSKVIETYDCDAKLTPNVIIEYWDSTSEYSSPYAMVDTVAYEIDENGDERQVLYATTNDFNRDKLYASSLGLFDGLEQGDFIHLYGHGKTITSWTMEKSIEDIKNYDISSAVVNFDSQSTNVFELYSVFDETKIVLQSGELLSDSKRKHMQCNTFYRNCDWGSFIYDATGRKPTVNYFYNMHALDTALNDGNDAASLVYIRAHGTVTKFIVVYKGINSKK